MSCKTLFLLITTTNLYKHLLQDVCLARLVGKITVTFQLLHFFFFKVAVFCMLCKVNVFEYNYYNVLSATTISAGQLLCGGLFSGDSLSNWFAAVALLNSIADNPTQKEQLLRVQLATSIGNPPVSLLQQCCNILAQVHNGIPVNILNEFAIGVYFAQVHEGNTT